jgi:hypothetical protein
MNVKPPLRQRNAAAMFRVMGCIYIGHSRTCPGREGIVQVEAHTQARLEAVTF